MVPSAVPWISSTLTGLDGVHCVGSSNMAPAKTHDGRNLVGVIARHSV